MATASLSPVLLHFHSPSSFLYQQFQQHLQQDQNRASDAPVLPLTKRYPGPANPQHDISAVEWPNVVRRVIENEEPLRQVAKDYGVSHETVRRIIRTVRQQEKTE